MSIGILISVIIPCLNEEENILPVFNDLVGTLADFPIYEIIYVDDGSTDNTLMLIKQLAKDNTNVKYLSLSKNFGHQNAIRAGMDYALGSCVVTMDGDMQHPSALILKMIEKWNEGYHIVSAVRINNDNIPYIKKTTSALFYRLINAISETHIQPNAADFRLLDRSVVAVLKKMKEAAPFWRGLIAWSGFKQATISYSATGRHKGGSKYSFWKMMRFANQGVMSFSLIPLKASLFLGFLSTLTGFLYGIYALYATLLAKITVPGWTSIIVCILFFAGIQLIALGIIGEYIGKLYIEQKNRPNYIVMETSF